MSRERILACDDDDTIRLVISVCLPAGGPFDVTAVASGQELLDRFAAVRPDLVVLDVLMPGLDGPATLERLRKLPGGADVPVVFLSGRDEPAEVARLKSLGVSGVLAKPFDPTTLAGSLVEILDRHRRAAMAAPPLPTSRKREAKRK